MEQKLGRGISLRKKRTVKQKISNPIITKENENKAATLPSIREDQRRPPLVSNPSSNSLTVPRARGAPQESTADYVKEEVFNEDPAAAKRLRRCSYASLCSWRVSRGFSGKIGHKIEKP